MQKHFWYKPPSAPSPKTFYSFKPPSTHVPNSNRFANACSRKKSRGWYNLHIYFACASLSLSLAGWQLDNKKSNANTKQY